MLRSHLRVAIRHLIRNKAFSAIHILGLAVGISAFTLITAYVDAQMSYDKCFADNEHIYRVAYQRYENDELKDASARNFVGVNELLKLHFPEVAAATAFDRTGTQAHFLFSYEGRRHFEQESLYQTDSNFFKVFPSLLLKGNIETVLKDPHNIVLSEKMATKIFGTDDPIGKRIENGSHSFSDVDNFVVTGIMKDLPSNAHFHVNFIAQNSHAEEWDQSAFWNRPRMYTYLRLSETANPQSVADHLNRIIDDLETENPLIEGTHVMLQHVSDIHLDSHLPDELETNGSRTLVIFLSLIGTIILVLAWINYINIETARFVTRMKEVSIRRIIGSSKKDLALQFLTGYILILLLASVLVVGMLWFGASLFKNLTGNSFNLFEWGLTQTWMKAFATFLAGSLIVGIYPAIALMKITPINSLRGHATGRKNGMSLRRSLILVQFASALFLLSFLSIIYRQLGHLQLINKNVDLDQVISIRNPSVYTNEDSVNYVEYEALKSKLMQNHQVKAVTSASVVPGIQIEEYFTNRLKTNLTAPYDPTPYKILFIDYDFIPFYDIKIKAGRNYAVDEGDEENWNKVILNEAAVLALGFETVGAAIDKDVYFHLWGSEFEKYRIVGIIEDYHHETVKQKVPPTIFSLNHAWFQQVFYSIKLNAGSDPVEGVRYIGKCWKEMFPDKPFDYYFQDELYDQQFKSELLFGRLFGMFSAVAVFIACLGVFGAALFEANARLKEISVRKVLGATASSLLMVLSREYVRLIAIAALVSIPFAYLYGNEWLLSYPSRISIGVWYFLLPLTGMLLLIVLVSISMTLKVANSNPVANLKQE